MWERDWLLSVFDELGQGNRSHRKGGRTDLGGDLTEIIELTKKRIDNSFDLSKKLKGRYRSNSKSE
jgi:hypothetical protein